MKRIVITLAATAACVLGAGIGVASASTMHVRPAITPSCGSSCFVLSNLQAGHDLVQNAYRQSNPAAPVTGKINLSGAVNDGWREDFTNAAGSLTLGEAVTDKLISATSYAAINLSPSSPVVEGEYAPYGADSELCVTWTGNGLPVELLPCGTSARGLWVLDIHHAFDGATPIINAGDTNITDPQVLALVGSSKNPADELVTKGESFTGGFAIDAQMFRITF